LNQAARKLKPKYCKVCGDMYDPVKPMQSVCSPLCGLKLVNIRKVEKAKKEFNKETKRLKESIKTKRDYTKEAQREFNKFIRLRDWNQPCISCGDTNNKDYLTGSKWDCGHYRSVGSAPELRFTELNAYKQCVKCNRDLSGNHVEYRINLVKRIGQEQIEWLEGPHEPAKWTIEDLKELKKHYATKAKEQQAKIKEMEEGV